MKLKKGDNVMVISGKDRGTSGKILRVLKDDSRIIVDGVNMRKKHKRPRQQGKKGEIANIPLPMHASNVMIVCSKCGKPTRIGRTAGDGGKSRVCKKCGGEL